MGFGTHQGTKLFCPHLITYLRTFFIISTLLTARNIVFWFILCFILLNLDCKTQLNRKITIREYDTEIILWGHLKALSSPIIGQLLGALVDFCSW